MTYVLDKTNPECHWVAVIDAAGRRRMEMRWVSASPALAVELRRAA